MKKRTYFQFNPDSLSFEKVVPSLKKRIKGWLMQLFAGVGIASSVLWLILLFIDSPSERLLKKENQTLLAQQEYLEREMEQIQAVLSDLEQRDNNMYRAILDAEPIATNIRKGNFSKSSRYEELQDLPHAALLQSGRIKIDELKRQLYIQSNSYDDLILLKSISKDKIHAIPAIQPVFNKSMRHSISAFGRRNDPIFNTPRFHGGMDFPAPTGTPIYATGNGEVTLSGWKKGYGNTIMINHGFGYQTLYGHLDKIEVKARQKLKRGDRIGTVGNTGRSFGSHLHYEVILRGERVNPINYYFMDLSAQEYDQMLQDATNNGKIFD